MGLNPGDILHIYCIFTKPFPKYKFVICICPISSLFFLINSKPRRNTLDAQIIIKKADYSFLTDDSYINTATICTFGQPELGKAKKVGSLSNSLRGEIVKVTKKIRYLTPLLKELISKNFSL